MASNRRAGLGSSLPQILLMVAAIELAVYRLAVPGLKPTNPNDAPPIWHTGLSYVGLFLSYFGSILAVGVVLRQLILLARGEHRYWKPIACAMVAVGAGFAVYAVKSLVGAPTEVDTSLLEICFSAMLVLLVVAQLKPGGDVAAKVGLLLLTAPLLIHFYRDAEVRWLLGDEALGSGLPERIAAYGQWSMVLAALLSPYCFAPRPFVDSAGRLGPLAMGAFVGVIGALVMRQSAEVGVRIASDGLGIDLGAGAPGSQVALYLIALGSITWTLAACFLSPSPARRRIGTGLGLIAAAGYGFDWPLQYLAGMVGFLTIGDAVREVADEERSSRGWTEVRFRTPPIAGEAWQAYVVALVEALRARGLRASTVSVEDPSVLGAEAREPEREGGGEGGESVRAGDAAPSVRADGTSRTHVLIVDAAPVPVRLLVERLAGAVRLVEVVCGRDPRATGAAPAWTLEARPERRLAVPIHPAPPDTGAPLARTGDVEFDRRFRMRDGGGHAARLFDDGQRARATALLDGWLALWPGQALIYRVVPGHGAPLDNPIPISDLAFRGAIWDGAVDRLVTVLELLIQLAASAWAGAEKVEEPGPGDSLDHVPPAGERAYGGVSEPEPSPDTES